MQQTGRLKRRLLCVHVEEASGERGTSLDISVSVGARSCQPRPCLSWLPEPWAVSRFQGFKVCVCVSVTSVAQPAAIKTLQIHYQRCLNNTLN